jgi:cytochrome b involved in lipid metabolism
MDKQIIEKAKRNYFLIGSILTFFVVGGATLYAKTGNDGQSLSQLLGIENRTNAGLEQEVEIEHGVITPALKPHGSDRTMEPSIESPSHEGIEQEVEFEHGVMTVTTKSHGDDGDEENEHRRGRDDDDEDEDWGDDHSWNGESAPTTPTPSSPTPTPSQPVTTFTMAEVATHANAQSCYTTVSGGVYDVTSYIPIHKGGSAAILAICGKDGSSLFAGQHAGEPKPEQALASFKIGTLVQ